MDAVTCRIFMNEQLRWTLQATCSVCSGSITAALHMGVEVHCSGCGARVTINPAMTTFHNDHASGPYWLVH
jgi:hypothetical protein